MAHSWCKAPRLTIILCRIVEANVFCMQLECKDNLFVQSWLPLFECFPFSWNSISKASFFRFGALRSMMLPFFPPFISWINALQETNVFVILLFEESSGVPRTSTEWFLLMHLKEFCPFAFLHSLNKYEGLYKIMQSIPIFPKVDHVVETLYTIYISIHL